MRGALADGLLQLVDVAGLISQAQVPQQQQGLDLYGSSASPALFPRRVIRPAVGQITRAKTAVPSASRLVFTTSHDKSWDATGCVIRT